MNEMHRQPDKIIDWKITKLFFVIQMAKTNTKAQPISSIDNQLFSIFVRAQ